MITQETFTMRCLDGIVRRTLQKVRVHRNYVTEAEATLAAKALRCLGPTEGEE